MEGVALACVISCVVFVANTPHVLMLQLMIC